MRKFFLLRHCEANQNEENIDDLEKKLSANGNRDAILIKKWFLSNNLNLGLSNYFGRIGDWLDKNL